MKAVGTRCMLRLDCPCAAIFAVPYSWFEKKVRPVNLTDSETRKLNAMKKIGSWSVMELSGGNLIEFLKDYSGNPNAKLEMPEWIAQVKNEMRRDIYRLLGKEKLDQYQTELLDFSRYFFSNLPNDHIPLRW